MIVLRGYWEIYIDNEWSKVMNVDKNKMEKIMKLVIGYGRKYNL